MPDWSRQAVYTVSFFTFWAVISGLVVFGQFPNTLAITGIVLVVVSGVAAVMLGERQRKLAPAA